MAVHNALAALGLAQVGAIQQGVLAEGQTARVTLDLPAGCVTVAAIGGAGVRDIDATLLDPREVPLAHDTTTEPQAVLRPCLESAGTYVLALKASAGAGPWVTATWAGAVTSAGAASPPPSAANGSCEAPIPLSPGTVSGSTTHGEHDNAGSCGPSDSRELVYELDVSRRERVTIEVEARFDSVLYIRKDDCTDPSAEVDCNDDGPDRTHSRIERVLDPGKYFVFVDGYGQESGTFKMTVSTSDVLALAEVCHRRRCCPPARRSPARPRGWPTTRGRRAEAGPRARTPRGGRRSRRGRACGWSSTRTSSRPSSTSGAPAPTSRARWRAPRAQAPGATPP